MQQNRINSIVRRELSRWDLVTHATRIGQKVETSMALMARVKNGIKAVDQIVGEMEALPRVVMPTEAIPIAVSRFDIQSHKPLPLPRLLLLG